MYHLYISEKRTHPRLHNTDITQSEPDQSSLVTYLKYEKPIKTLLIQHMTILYPFVFLKSSKVYQF